MNENIKEKQKRIDDLESYNKLLKNRYLTRSEEKEEINTALKCSNNTNKKLDEELAELKKENWEIKLKNNTLQEFKDYFENNDEEEKTLQIIKESHNVEEQAKIFYGELLMKKAVNIKYKKDMEILKSRNKDLKKKNIDLKNALFEITKYKKEKSLNNNSIKKEFIDVVNKIDLKKKEDKFCIMEKNLNEENNLIKNFLNKKKPKNNNFNPNLRYKNSFF